MSSLTFCCICTTRSMSYATLTKWSDLGHVNNSSSTKNKHKEKLKTTVIKGASIEGFFFSFSLSGSCSHCFAFLSHLWLQAFLTNLLPESHLAELKRQGGELDVSFQARCLTSLSCFRAAATCWLVETPADLLSERVSSASSLCTKVSLVMLMGFPS